jgi:transcriptional regulator with XRE-family HTH domain
MKRGKRYSQARNTLGLSQDELSEIIGITQTSVSKMERDKFEKPNHEYTDYLVSQGFNRIWLVDGEGEMKTENETFNYKTKGIKYSDDSKIEKLTEEDLENIPEVKELLEKLLEQQEENGKMLTNILHNLSRAFTIIENLTNNREVNLGKHKAYSVQPVGYQDSTAVYAYS